jgi:hypothetical protein
MLLMRYGGKVVSGFEGLVKLLPPDAVASPLRSTVPLVDFWRTPGARLAQFSAAIGVRSADRRLCGLRFFLRFTLPNPIAALCFRHLWFFVLKSRGPQRRGSALHEQIRGLRPDGSARPTNTGNISATGSYPWPVLAS